MVGGIVIPPQDYLRRFFLSTLRHVVSVEFVLDELQIGSSDPQRPHDIMGEGNKFQENVLFGLAMQYDEMQCKRHVCPALQLHRQGQVHHQMWNGPNPAASEDALKLGAVDAVCSLLEDRAYQGGRHTYEQIEQEVIPKNQKPIQKQYLGVILSEMKKIELPKVELITSLHLPEIQEQLNNIGLPKNTKAIICDRSRDVLHQLLERYNIRL